MQLGGARKTVYLCANRLHLSVLMNKIWSGWLVHQQILILFVKNSFSRTASTSSNHNCSLSILKHIISSTHTSARIALFYSTGLQIECCKWLGRKVCKNCIKVWQHGKKYQHLTLLWTKIVGWKTTFCSDDFNTAMLATHHATFQTNTAGRSKEIDCPTVFSEQNGCNSFLQRHLTRSKSTMNDCTQYISMITLVCLASLWRESVLVR